MLNRHNRILTLLKQKGTVTVSELTQNLAVSPATVRRDLEILEQENHLRRTYGGAIEYQQTGFEPLFTDRMTDCLAEKQAIAQVAARLVEPGDIVAFDTGTTTSQIARLLVGIAPLTVLTPSLAIAQIFAEADNSEHTIILPGGIVRGKTLSLVGPLTEENLINLRCDKLFIGCQTITPENGIMNTNLLAFGTKRALVAISQKIIVVADHTKFGKISLSTIAPLHQLDTIITDSKTPALTLQPYRDAGITVLTANC